MTETRDFPTAVIASLATGVLLCEFGKMHEAAQYLMGHPIWSHQFGDREFNGEIKRTISEQCPGMPTDLPEANRNNWQDHLAKIVADLGPTVRIRKGDGLTAMLPTDGIPDHLKNKTIIVERE